MPYFPHQVWEGVAWGFLAPFPYIGSWPVLGRAVQKLELVLSCYIGRLPSCNISLNTETIHVFIVDLGCGGLFAHPLPLHKSSRSI